GDESVQGNMFVPIDLVVPVLDDLTKLGRRAGPARPWLGMYTAELKEELVVNGLAQGGPADKAGVRLGDVVLEVDGRPVAGLADLFRKIWRLGSAGTDIPLTLSRQRSRVAVQLTYTPTSAFLITSLLEGKYDLAFAVIDNVVAYQEGQGEAKISDNPDLFAFMGCDGGFLSLFAAPEVKSAGELKGKAVSV